MEVCLQSEEAVRQGHEPSRLSRSSFKHQYWTPAQMVTHHTSGGCRLREGDLLGTGTISGPGAGEAGALIELTQGGRTPVTLSTGEKREFLNDGDTVIMKAWCERPGAARIGFGVNAGKVLAPMC